MSVAVRRIFAGAGVGIIVLAVAAVALWIGLTRSYKAPSPMRCLPTSTAMVFRFGNRPALRAAADTAKYSRELAPLLGGETAWRLVCRLDSLLGPEMVKEPAVHERDIYVSFNLDTAGRPTDWTASFMLNNRLEWHKAMMNLKKQRNVSVGDTTVLGRDLYLLREKGSDEPLFMAAGGGCLFASLTPVVPASFGDDAVAKMHDDPGFSMIERTATTSSPLSVFMNVRLVSPSLFGRLVEGAGDFSSALASVGRGNEWAVFDIGLHPGGLTADGFAVSTRNSLSTLSGRGTPSPFDVARRIPQQVRRFVSLGAGKRGLSSEPFMDLMEADTAGREYRERQNDIFRRTNIDAEALLSQAFSSEVAYCSYAEAEGERGSFVVLNTRGGTLAMASLTQALTALHEGEMPHPVGEISPGVEAVPQGVSSRRTDAQRVGDMSIPVYNGFRKGDYTFFLPYLFGCELPCSYFFRYEDVIVLSDDMGVLKRVLGDYLLGHTLSRDKLFTQLRGDFATDCSKFSFTKFRKGGELSVLGCQQTMIGNLPYMSMSAHCATPSEPVQEAKWRVRLEKAVVGRPTAVVNHYTHETECLVQDTTGTLYLIGADGMILWKRAIDGPIVGEVSQIDVYGNSKLQYAFTTRSMIYVVDRLGNDVRPFPVRLPSQVVSGVWPVVYQDGSPMRLFVGGQGGVLLYGLDGKQVEGWGMKQPEGRLRGEISHFVTSGKDYIVSHDQYAYYYTDRRGAPRMTPAPVAPAEWTRMGQTVDGKSFVCSAADGAVVKVDAVSGKAQSVTLDSIGSGATGFPLGSAAYMVVGTGSICEVSTEKLSVVNSWSVELAEVTQVVSRGNLVAVYDSVQSKAYVYTIGGREVEASPFDANGEIDIALTPTGFLLLTLGGEGEVVCYRAELQD